MAFYYLVSYDDVLNSLLNSQELSHIHILAPILRPPCEALNIIQLTRIELYILLSPFENNLINSSIQGIFIEYLLFTSYCAVQMEGVK